MPLTEEAVRARNERATANLEKHRWKKGRGPAKFFFTYDDLARVKGISRWDVLQEKKEKQFDPRDLASVVKYLAPVVLKERE